MTDELDTMKAAMKSAAPPPEAEARAAATHLAMENFDRMHASLQGSVPGPRLSSDRPIPAAGVKGVWKMLKQLAGRPAFVTAPRPSRCSPWCWFRCRWSSTGAA